MKYIFESILQLAAFPLVIIFGFICFASLLLLPIMVVSETVSLKPLKKAEAFEFDVTVLNLSSARIKKVHVEKTVITHRPNQ